jgi:hypothetical protein
LALTTHPPVQKPPGDAAVALHPAGTIANPRTEATHFSTSGPNPEFANQTSQIRETKNRAYEFTARRSLHAGIVPNRVPNEVRWKNLLRHLRVPLPAGNSF